ncbi:hypothetical protein D9619_004744 [Psilocybe cf. subviscida]|uniref:Uncharacterized protein n=1 Tax=Psilocybe cf. subviscida TaxID=2480587 RepID=A0A8H5F822_9AGAR|nr:hypothetical protein D9619_004744 [Psilocybe cf. subviscida]
MNEGALVSPSSKLHMLVVIHFLKQTRIAHVDLRVVGSGTSSLVRRCYIHIGLKGLYVLVMSRNNFTSDSRAYPIQVLLTYTLHSHTVPKLHKAAITFNSLFLSWRHRASLKLHSTTSMSGKGDHEAPRTRPQGLKRVISFSRLKAGFRLSEYLAQTNYYYFEASISPVKYSVYQLLGHLSITFLFDAPPLSLPTSSFTSAKMGALGGVILTLYYLIHLCICDTWFYEGRPLEPASTYVAMFAQEVFHSGIAAILGATIIGFSTYFQLASTAVVALLGPVALVTILFTVLGVTLVVLWTVKWFMARWLSR